jgi:hypothetical protein
MSRSSSADASFAYWKADCLSRQTQLGGWAMGLRPHFYQSSERHRADPRAKRATRLLARGRPEAARSKTWDQVTVQYPPGPAGMAAGMTIAMVAWMLFRGWDAGTPSRSRR